MIDPDTAFVVAKDHVHDPVQAVLDAPMVANDRPHGLRQQKRRRAVEAGLDCDLAEREALARGEGGHHVDQAVDEIALG